MFGPEIIQINESIKIAWSAFLKDRAERGFENLTLVARWREHFRIFLAIFLLAQLSPKKLF